MSGTSSGSSGISGSQTSGKVYTSGGAPVWGLILSDLKNIVGFPAEQEKIRELPSAVWINPLLGCSVVVGY